MRDLQEFADQASVEDFRCFMRLLGRARTKLNSEDFMNIWPGNPISTHYWRKFSGDYDHDLVRFVAYLDEPQVNVFLEHILKESINKDWRVEITERYTHTRTLTLRAPDEIALGRLIDEIQGDRDIHDIDLHELEFDDYDHHIEEDA